MTPSYWTPEAQITQSFPTSPRVTFALGQQILFAIRQHTLPVTGYLALKENDAVTRSLKFRGAIGSQRYPSAVGVPQQERVVTISREMRI